MPRGLRGLVALVGLLVGLTVAMSGTDEEEEEARRWLAETDRRLQVVLNEDALFKWAHYTNLTAYNQQRRVASAVRKAQFRKQAARNASRYNWQAFKDEDLKRQFSKLAIIGLDALPKEQVEEATNLKTANTDIYSKAQVCGRPRNASECLSYDPDLAAVLAESRDWDELVWAWKGWRDATGRHMRDRYTDFINYHNKAARQEGFSDVGEYWRSWYEDEDFEASTSALWEQVRPLYQQLHHYVKGKLQQIYPDRPFPATGHIPAHILGNNWAQTWPELYFDVAPFPNKEAIDVTAQLKEQNFNARRMFEMAEEFFTSLGLDPMPELFWKNSMIEKPADRDVVCHASAWDFSNGSDFRILMCTETTHSDFVTVHHEMGHVQYFLQYKVMPPQYHEGGNPGFHEAIGDVMSLSVSTPEHLHKIGLLASVTNDNESDLNFLLYMALDKIAFLPFGYLIDQWRWEMFRGNIHPDNYTRTWTELRCKIQGVSPPVPRGPEDFDPGAKYHVCEHVPYIRYFVSFIIQFQFHKSLCEAAGHTGPLHRCDIYRSEAAGEKLRSMLSMGSSKPWPDAMEQLTGGRKMDAAPLMEYFAPLTEWLKEQNAGQDVGWDDHCPQGSFVEVSSSPRLEGMGLGLLSYVVISLLQLCLSTW